MICQGEVAAVRENCEPGDGAINQNDVDAIAAVAVRVRKDVL